MMATYTYVEFYIVTNRELSYCAVDNEIRRNKHICHVFQGFITMATRTRIAMDTEYFGQSSICIFPTLLLNIVTLSTPVTV